MNTPGVGRRLSKDPDLIELVEQYLSENCQLSYINIEDMTEKLQSKSFRFARMKKQAFASLVHKAYEEYCNRKIVFNSKQDKDTLPSSSRGIQNVECVSSDSDIEIEEQSPRPGLAGNQVSSLYNSSPNVRRQSGGYTNTFKAKIDTNSKKIDMEKESLAVTKPTYVLSTTPTPSMVETVYSKAVSPLENRKESFANGNSVGKEHPDSDNDLEIIEEVAADKTIKKTAGTDRNSVLSGPVDKSHSRSVVATGQAPSAPKFPKFPDSSMSISVPDQITVTSFAKDAQSFDRTVLSLVQKDSQLEIRSTANKKLELPRSTDSPIITTENKRGIKRKTETYLNEELNAPNISQKKLKREVNVTNTFNYKFSDFAGSESVVEEICKLLMHLKHPEIYKRLGVTPPRGFLLHGPPGCGKTLLANAISGELEMPMLKMAATELVSGVSGESENNIRDLFNQALSLAPCIIFIDEIDAITPKRETAQREMERRIVAQLLSCIDDLATKDKGDQVLLIGATNRIEAIDTGLRRAGRFDREICLGIPDVKAREKILRVISRGLRLIPNFDYELLAKLTPGYVGADLQALIREAAIQAVNKALIKSAQVEVEVPIVPTVACVKVGTDILKNGNDEVTSEMTNDNKSCDTEAAKSKETDECEVNEVAIIRVADVFEPMEVDNAGDSSSKEEAEQADSTSAVEETSEKEKSHTDSVEKALLSTDDVLAIVCGGPIKKTSDNSDVSILCSDSPKPTTGTSDVPNTTATSPIVLKDISCDVPDVDKPDVIKNSDTLDISMPSQENSIPVKAPEFAWKGSLLEKTDVLINNHVGDSPLKWIKEIAPLDNQQLDELFINMDNFVNALKNVQPSSKREGFATVPDITWDDIGALKDIRDELQVAILGPVKHAAAFQSLGLNSPAGSLLCGPPGVGKTLLAKAIANEAGINFISVKGPELLNMYVGESERAVRQCFLRARNSAPCVIFFDELDALCPRRSEVAESGSGSRIVNQLLTEMDGMESRLGVFVMAATNRPDIIDPAVLRPGRLDKILFVDFPTAADRLEILKAITKNGTKPVFDTDVDLKEITGNELCENYTGADLAALVREASIAAFREIVLGNTPGEDQKDLKVSKRHFEIALSRTKPSVSKQDREKYDKMKIRFAIAGER